MKLRPALGVATCGVVAIASAVVSSRASLEALPPALTPLVVTPIPARPAPVVVREAAVASSAAGQLLALAPVRLVSPARRANTASIAAAPSSNLVVTARVLSVPRGAGGYAPTPPAAAVVTASAVGASASPVRAPSRLHGSADFASTKSDRDKGGDEEAEQRRADRDRPKRANHKGSNAKSDRAKGDRGEAHAGKHHKAAGDHRARRPQAAEPEPRPARPDAAHDRGRGHQRRDR